MTDYEKELSQLTDYDREVQKVDTTSMSDYEKELAAAKPSTFTYDDIDTHGLPFPKRSFTDILTGSNTSPEELQNQADNNYKYKYFDDEPLVDSSLDMTLLPTRYAGEVAAAGANAATKTIGLASDVAGSVLKPVNKLIGKVTEPMVNKTKELLTRPSAVGSKADWFKTNFVQDYKLSDEFVDLIDTQLRLGKVKNDDVMDGINEMMHGLSSYDRDLVQYLVSKDKVAFPKIHESMNSENVRWHIEDMGLDTRAKNLRQKIWGNQDSLNKLGMLEDRHIQVDNLFQNRGDDGVAYVNHQYKNRDKLNLDRGLNAGRTIPGRRGMYTEEGKFIRPFTEAERLSMAPETNKVAEKTIAKQLDDILQGETMDKTFKMKNLIKTPEDMKNLVGNVPRSKEAGYMLLQGREYGNLSGHYVQEQTAQRLKSMVDDVNREPSLWNNYRKYVSQWKAAVTIKNPKTHINNMLGNAGMITTVSDIPASKLSSIVSNGMNIYGNKAGNTTYRAALESGLLERTKVQEIAQMSGFDNAAAKVATNETKTMTGLKNLYIAEDSAVGEKVFGAYQAEDEVFKLGIFDHYLSSGSTPAQARAATEKIVFDYAKKLPKGVEFLRDTGLIPFVTWTYRSLPMFAEALAKRPGNLAATATALALLNEDDDSLTEPTVGGRKGNVKNITPYMEYLNPQEFVKDLTLSGIPQQVASLAAGQRLQYGRMRTLDKKGMSATDSLMGRAKGIYDLMPVPDVYNDLYDIATDKRSLVDSSIHRLLFTNTPKKQKRNR